MTAPRVYLDWDGVINAEYPDPGWGETRDIDDIFVWPAGLQRIGLRYAPALVDAINQLVDDGVELYWSTGWCASPTTPIVHAADLLGLRPGIVTPWRQHLTVAEWKVAHVQAGVDNGARVAWVDDIEIDDLSSEQIQKLWVGEPLLIPTESMVGLTPKHMEMIRVQLLG